LLKQAQLPTGRDLCPAKDPLLGGGKGGVESPQDAEGTESRPHAI